MNCKEKQKKITMPLRVKGGASAAQLWRVPEARRPAAYRFSCAGARCGGKGSEQPCGGVDIPAGGRWEESGPVQEAGLRWFPPPPAFRERVATFLERPHWKRGLLPGAERDVAEAVN